MFIVVILLLVTIGVVIWAITGDAQKKQEVQKKQEAQERHEKWKSDYEAQQEAYNAAKEQALAGMETQWGPCSKDIFVNRSDVFCLSDRVLAFEQAQKIVIDGGEYDFKDIIGVRIVNNSKTIYNAYTTGGSKKDLGDMIIRGAVGKIIGGDVGAVIGAMSSDEDYDYDTEYESEVENDYKVYVNVDSISSPTIVLDMGEDEEGTHEIANLLNVIIRRNSR